MTHTYDGQFFDYTDRSALRSAETVVPIVVKSLRCASVLDVGCGTGAWLSVYANRGVDDVTGLDGAYVDRGRLMIAPERFLAVDLAERFDLKRTFDLVQSLEVAEHLPPAASETMVANLCRHGSRVLFSAAVPGQGGEHHVNEQTYEFWRGLFAKQGFSPYDFLRPRLLAGHDVEPWYVLNTILYARDADSPSLPEDVRRTRVADGAPIANVAPVSFRIRTALLRSLPVSIVSKLSVWRREWLARG